MLDLKRLRILREVATRGLVLGAQRECALPLAVGGQPADRDARAGGRHEAARAHARGPEADRRGPDPGRATPRRPSRGSRRPSGSWRRSPASRAARCGSRASRAPARPCSPMASRASSARTRSVRLSVTEAEPEESMPQLRAGEVDLALVFDYPAALRGRRARHRARALADRVDARRAAAGPSARRAPKVRLADLADDVWLCGRLPELLRRDGQAGLPRRGLRPAVGFESRRLPRAPGLRRRRASASRCCPTWRCRRCAPTSSSARPTRAAPVRRVWAATRRGRALAGDRGDARSPARGRRALRRPAARAARVAA